MRELVWVAAMLAGSGPTCRGGAEPGGDGASRGGAAEATKEATGEATGAARSDPCGAAALGLGSAAALTAWTPPAGCTARGHGTGVVRGAAELDARLACAGGATAGVDFSRQALVVADHTLSPAGAGLVAFDDGEVVTLVTRQRHPCPGEPMAMPMNVTVWFALPSPGERTIAGAVCTVDSACR